MKLVILDRDGTINVDSDEFIKTPEEWQPMPGAPALPCTFKWVGNVTKNGKALRKIMVTMKQSKSDKQGELSISISESASGYVLFDAGRGKVMEGVVDRTAKQTVKHATQGTQTKNQVSKQSFVKI